MTKLIPIFIEGRRWIQLGQLPIEEEKSLKSWLPSSRFKTIEFQGMVLQDCLDFSVYSYWRKSYGLGHSGAQEMDF
ncbi:hypothetical protein [Algoriphagus namhaensis]